MAATTCTTARDVHAAVRGGRCADTHERDLGVADGSLQVLSSRQPAGGHLLSDQVGQPGLRDRGLPGVDLRHLGRIHVHSEDGVAVATQTGGRHAADVSHSEYRNLRHGCLLALIHPTATARRESAAAPVFHHISADPVELSGHRLRPVSLSN